MNILNITVANKIATYRKLDGSIVCGNSDYQVKFTFDEEWTDHNEKTARFIWNGQYVEVGVYAGNLETTTAAVIPALRSILCGGATPTPENDEHYANEAKEAAERAEAAAEKAATYIPADGKSAYAYAQEGGYAGTEAEFAADINPDTIKRKATPIKGVDYFDGKNGKDGSDYVLTEADYEAIAGRAIEIIKTGGVYGFVDDDKKIVLSGNIAFDEYTFGYMVDGEFVELGKGDYVPDTPAEPSYTNLLPLAVDANGNAYVGTNGEDGYKEGYKISVSGGGESSASGYKVTGFIPVSYGETLYFKNISFEASGTNTNYCLYDANKQRIGGGNWYQIFSSGVNGEKVSTTINSSTPLNQVAGSINDVAFIRFSASVMDENSVVAKQDIV